jgi:hypothetical protein
MKEGGASTFPSREEQVAAATDERKNCLEIVSTFVLPRQVLTTQQR